MGVEIKVDEAAEIVVVTWRGTITLEDFIAARSSVMAATGWSPRFDHVLDFTDVDSLELSHDDVRSLANAPSIFHGSARQVLVARSGSVQFGLSRMFGAYADGKRDVHIVHSMEAALSFLRRAR